MNPLHALCQRVLSRPRETLSFSAPLPIACLYNQLQLCAISLPPDCRRATTAFLITGRSLPEGNCLPTMCKTRHSEPLVGVGSRGTCKYHSELKMHPAGRESGGFAL